MLQAQSDAFNAWFDARFAQAVAEGSAFDNAWVASIAEALGHDRQRMFNHVAKAVVEIETRFEARLAAQDMRAAEAEARASAAEARFEGARRISPKLVRNYVMTSSRLATICANERLTPRSQQLSKCVSCSKRNSLRNSRRWRNERRRPRSGREQQRPS
jgi:hypothetical protein